MAWSRTLTNLTYLLAGLYPLAEDAGRLVDAAGIPKAHVAFSRRGIDTWHAILVEADRRGRVDALIAAARRDYPEHEALAQAAQGSLLTLSGPLVGETLPWRGTPEPASLERILGARSSLVPVSFLEQGLGRARAVARVVLPNDALGSGFLIAGNLFVTNHHVLGSPEAAREAVLEFNYQQDASGLALAVATFRCDPAAGFLASAEDDWAVVRVWGEANEAWGALPMEPVPLSPGDRVNIIQHPGGRAKQLAFFHNLVTYADARRVQYLTDTEPGSSGAPVFDRQWRLVAVHHSGGWMPEPGTSRQAFRNEGIAISCMVEPLRRAGLLP